MDEALQRLLDKDEIVGALLRYTRGLDRLDIDAIRSAYHADSLEHHGTFNGTSHDFAEYVTTKGVTRYERTQHHLSNTAIEFDGDTAYVETYFVALHTRPDGNSGFVLDSMGGRYIDRFERRDGGPWLIADRTVVHDWTDARPLAAVAAWQGLYIDSQRGQDDLVYLRAKA
jgi:hypothetical protein